MTGAPFEALGDRRFQQFAQSLITAEFPEAQAVPVGQPDGGRDAFVAVRRRPDAGDDYAPRSRIVFQVRFVERPDYVRDARAWVRRIVRAEEDNLRRLIANGAETYYLVTNVPGSAHFGTGSIDLGNEALDELLSIDGRIWWRGDIEARLDRHPELRWAYRELLTGQDVLHELVGTQLTEDRDRRRNALNFALSAQYEADTRVRFKQIDLDNELLRLFVDVPAVPKAPAHRLGPGRRRLRPAVSWDDVPWGQQFGGAAELLLDPAQPLRGINRWVVEGAPGQGKSTLSQYLCQVHRARLLGDETALSQLPEAHRTAPVRLPFKVELRHLATFLRGGDPFEQVPGWPGIAGDYQRSLSSFLALQIRRYAGGAEFSVSDLLAVATKAPLLLVLDGLDEIADPGDRRMTIEAVDDGLAGLKVVAAGLQVVVTSRPASTFANSPGFSERVYSYVSLASLGAPLILEYAGRWAEARKLDAEDAASTISLLKTKLTEPHLRDLARNPMQLAILLSLINTKAESLPDKRTQLYDSYMSLFFDREGSKTKAVRKNRELLYGLHGYLGWRLHVAAERRGRDGSITTDELEDLTARYIAAQGRDASLTGELLHGVQRLVALVETKDNRFEFEVQPLREFFAAHHLYHTAQVSQLGNERPGTREDRIDGLLRNAFWLNVLRFYAGFYTSGELPALADRLEEFASDPVYALTDRPRMVAAMLLADWSLSLDRRSRERVVRLALRGLGSRHALSALDGWETTMQVLPEGSGGEKTGEEALRLLRERRFRRDRELALARVWAQHSADDTVGPVWRTEAAARTGPARTTWIECGIKHGVFASFSDADIVQHVVGDDCADEFGPRAWLIADHGREEVLVADDRVLEAAIDSWVTGEILFPGFEGRLKILGVWADAIEGLPTGFLRETYGEPPPRRAFERHPYLAMCWDVWSMAVADAPDDSDAILKPGPYRTRGAAIERCRSACGDGLALAVSVGTYALRARLGRARREEPRIEHDAPLLERAVVARGQRHNAAWWRESLERPMSERATQIGLLWAMTFMTDSVLADSIAPLNAAVGRLDDDRLVHVARAVRELQIRTDRLGRSLQVDVRRVTPGLALLLTRRGRVPADVWDRIRRHRGTRPPLLEAYVEHATTVCPKEQWGRMLGEVQRTYARTSYEGAEFGFEEIPHEPAAAMVESPARYPLRAVNAAEAVLRSAVNTRSRRVGDVARSERWFKRDQ